MEPLYVQYGCGLCAPEGWLNFDASPTLRAQRIPLLSVVGRKIKPVFPENVQYGDIRSGLPLADRSCAAVYCSHVLEHLALDDCRRALANSFKILQPNGRFRFVMPNLRLLVEEYLANPAPDAAISFLKESLIGQQHRPTGLLGNMRPAWVGNSDHRWLWDYASIEQELKQVGFANIRPAKFGDSEDPHFAKVENPSRWDRALSAECVRPG